MIGVEPELVAGVNLKPITGRELVGDLLGKVGREPSVAVDPGELPLFKPGLLRKLATLEARRQRRESPERLRGASGAPGRPGPRVSPLARDPSRSRP